MLTRPGVLAHGPEERASGAQHLAPDGDRLPRGWVSRLGGEARRAAGRGAARSEGKQPAGPPPDGGLQPGPRTSPSGQAGLRPHGPMGGRHRRGQARTIAWSRTPRRRRLMQGRSGGQAGRAHPTKKEVSACRFRVIQIGGPARESSETMAVDQGLSPPGHLRPPIRASVSQARWVGTRGGHSISPGGNDRRRASARTGNLSE